jgi:hypothetical protein
MFSPAKIFEPAGENTSSPPKSPFQYQRVINQVVIFSKVLH